jgi:hypothetical protein
MDTGVNMAFYIRISKLSETDAAVVYTFESDSERRGVLSLDKETGETSLIEEMPGDERMQCFNRAAFKVGREWKSGFLPELLEWAS